MSQFNLNKEFNGARALIIIHLVLALLIPFFFSQIGGCEHENDVEKVEVGAEVSPAEIDEALNRPLANTSPLSIKLGEAYVFSEVQELAAGAAKSVLSDTSQSVIERTETATDVSLTIIEHKQTYNNGEVKKVSTEIPIRISKNAQTKSVPLEALKPSIHPEVQRMMTERSKLRLQSDSNQPRVTFHKLKYSVAMESPPTLVAQQPGCLGIPNCKLEVHRINFDIVFWENNEPERTHLEYVMSPAAPYLAGILNKCVTSLAAVGSGESKILVKQCLPVINFRYSAPQQ